MGILGGFVLLVLREHREVTDEAVEEDRLYDASVSLHVYMCVCVCVGVFMSVLTGRRQ